MIEKINMNQDVEESIAFLKTSCFFSVCLIYDIIFKYTVGEHPRMWGRKIVIATNTYIEIQVVISIQCVVFVFKSFNCNKNKNSRVQNKGTRITLLADLVIAVIS